MGRRIRVLGVPASHEPGTNRGNAAAGLSANGDLIALISGWSGRAPAPNPTPILFHDRSDPLFDRFRNRDKMHPLDALICRSSDGGRTWSREGEIPTPEGVSWDSPRIIVTYHPRDPGVYPASVQIADGTVVTAYYSAYAEAHHR